MRICRRSVFLVFVIVLVSCQSKVESSLWEVDGVQTVDYYLQTEGKIEATVLLDNGGVLGLFGLGVESFEKTDTIFLTRIGSYFLRCKHDSQLGETTSGHNILEIYYQLNKVATRSPRIENIQELVENYELVLGTVERLPDFGNEGLAIRFRGRSPLLWECTKQIESLSAAN